MKRKISLITLSACAALAGASAQEPQQQQEQHVIASPNPTIDDSKSTAVEPGKVTVERIQPATTATAAPMKQATRPKRKRRSRP
jgi:hypothetical protein